MDNMFTSLIAKEKPTEQHQQSGKDRRKNLYTKSKTDSLHPAKEYYTFKEFLAVCVQRNFRNRADYHLKRLTDQKLPPSPKDYYKDPWNQCGGWEKITTRGNKRWIIFFFI